ncbi:hypothetical protein AN216_00025, partial [Streptomyces oceani]
AEGKAEGQAEERARQVLRVLEHRGITVSAEVRERITGCGDPEVLGVWVDRAFSVSVAEDLFAGLAQD